MDHAGGGADRARAARRPRGQPSALARGGHGPGSDDPGLPPKRAAQLVRFDRAVHRLAAGDAAVRVAADGGYADQSHLHRDVAAFAGVTPSAVAREPWLAVDDVAWPGRTR
ncbi:helix-turn-helix domain-containing protein [Streptomyces sp. NBC_00536]|uniref:helix-turn-helix domain-containing protein n=1 Tax=Streptomyces sp. NBC_00536 TaxID=2975769 RepID=UPI003FCE7FFD